ncbi:MAG: sulfotransferase [Gammaproteobacteria bacterium]|nr:sulfotransferase [Gammaproteobacteria bacterium]
MEFIVSYGMPYSGTTVFAKCLAKAIDGGTLNSRAEGVWEVQEVRPDQAEGLLKARWSPKTELLDHSLIDYWKSIAAASGRNYIVEKSPPLMFHRETLKSLIPELREFVLLRDPIQIYLSSRKRQIIDGCRLRKRRKQLELTTREWTESWCQVYLCRLDCLMQIYLDGVELIVFDDFIKDPETYLTGLKTLAGIPVEGVSSKLEVKGKEPEDIRSRDKNPDEWLSDWEYELITNSLNSSAAHNQLFNKSFAISA